MGRPRKWPFPFTEGIYTWAECVGMVVGMVWREFDRLDVSFEVSVQPTDLVIYKLWFINSWKWMIDFTMGTMHLTNLFLPLFITGEVAGFCWSLPSPYDNGVFFFLVHYTNQYNWIIEFIRKKWKLVYCLWFWIS